MRKYLVTAAIAAVAVVFVAAPAVAGKGGTHGSSGTTGSTAWVTATYSSGRVNLAGCGFAVAPATVVVGLPTGGSQTYSVGVWSTGCLDTAYFLASQAGTYTVTVSQGSGATASTSVQVS